MNKKLWRGCGVWLKVMFKMIIQGIALCFAGDNLAMTDQFVKKSFYIYQSRNKLTVSLFFMCVFFAGKHFLVTYLR